MELYMALTPQQQADLDRSLANMSPALQNFVKNLSNGSKTFTEIQDSLDAYKKSLANQTHAYTESNRVIGTHTKRQEQNIKKVDDTAEAFAKLASATRKAQEDVASSGRVTQDTMDAYNTALESIRTTTGEVDTELEDLGRSFATGSATIQSNLNRLSTSINDQAEQRLRDAQRMTRSNLPVVFDNISNAVRHTTSELSSVGGILRSLADVTDATSEYFEHLKTSVSHSTDTFNTLPGVTDSMFDLSQATGMSSKDLQQFSIQNRQAINALALQEDSTIDISDQNKVLRKSLGFLSSEFINTAGQTIPGLSTEFAHLTGSFKDGNMVLIQMMHNMRSIGMKATGKEFQQAADDMARELKVASIITGKSASELQSYVNETLLDPAIKEDLLKSSEQERKLKMKGIYAEMTHQAALGKLNSATLEASKALSSLKGKGAVDRFKASANVQMMFGALGLKGGGEFARLLSKKTNTAEEKKQMGEFGNTASRAINAKKAGGFNSEAFADFLLSVQDDNAMRYIDATSNIADEGMAISKDQLNSLQEQVRTSTEMNTKLGSIDGKILEAGLTVEKLSAAFKDPAAGIVTAIGKSAYGIIAAIASSSLFSSMSGSIARGGRGLTNTAARLGGRGLIRAGAKSLLKKIPIIGAVAGLGYGASRLMNGDLTGAAGEVASGAASTIPGVGTAASLGIDAALTAHDINRENSAIKNEIEYPTDTKNTQNMNDRTDMAEQIIKLQIEIRDILKEQNKHTQDVRKSVDIQSTIQKDNAEKLVDAQKDSMRKIQMKKTLADYDNVVSP
jgi:hypothetical protein